MVSSTLKFILTESQIGHGTHWPKCSIMNQQVSLRTTLTGDALVVNALLANISKSTQISERLAQQLELDIFHDVFVENLFMNDQPLVLWKISLKPIIISFGDMQRCVVFPVVNCAEGGSFYEMIIGTDCGCLHEILNVSMACMSSGIESKPTRGPGFKENVIYMGHNIGIVNKISEFAKPVKMFFEYLCFESEAIKRLAINTVSRKVVVVFRDSETVYKYFNVPMTELDLVTRLENGESKGQLVSQIKAVSRVEIIDNFPNTVLLTDGNI